MNKRRVAYLLLLAYAAIGGLVFPLTKPALSYISPYNYLFMRYLFASVIFLPVVIWFCWNKPLHPLVFWKTVLLEMFVAPAALILLYLGLARTTALESSLITMMAPIFTTFGGIYFLREKQERHEWIGLTLAFLGSALLVIEPMFNGAGNTSFSVSGNLLLLGYNLLVTLYFLVAKVVYKDVSKLFVAGLGAIFGLPAYFVLDAVTGHSSPQMLLQPSVLIAVVYIALYTVIAAPMYLFGQEKIEASEAGVFVYLSGVIGAPASVFLLNEKMSIYAGLCLVVIIVGVVLAEVRRKVKIVAHRKLKVA